MRFILLAFSLLTVLPMRMNDAPQPGDTGRAAGWYPLVGVVIGGMSALVFYGASRIFPAWLAAVLTAVAWIWLSGGLHLDGLADCCDGMLHASTPERRLEIMKDPRLGTFGGIGLVLAILLKISCLASLPIASAWIALPLAAASGRWMLLIAGKQPSARPGGMGADFALGLSARSFLPANILLAGLLVLAGWTGLAAFSFALLVSIALMILANARLKGLTGDVFGFIVEASELAVLLTFCVRWQ